MQNHPEKALAHPSLTPDNTSKVNNPNTLTLWIQLIPKRNAVESTNSTEFNTMDSSKLEKRSKRELSNDSVLRDNPKRDFATVDAQAGVPTRKNIKRRLSNKSPKTRIGKWLANESG